MILRSDQESAVGAVAKRLAAYREGRTMLEKTPVGESGANGRVEEAGKRVRDHAKTFKDQLEWNTGEKMDMDGDVAQWMVRWAGMVQTRFKVGSDGKTAWQRMKGRRCDIEVVPFG